jgi:UDP-glucose 4-epimerase
LRILVTGHLGRIGAPVAAALGAAGHEVVGFDLAQGQDLADAGALHAAAGGKDAVVHCAGLADDRGASAQTVLAANVLGTRNVLAAAASAGCRRVVHLSSGKALGMVHRPPTRLPLADGDGGPSFSSPYALSKWLSEEVCAAFTAETGVPTVCLRPTAVLCSSDDYAGYLSAREPATGWHLRAFVDLSDVVTAVLCALTCPDPGHVRVLVNAGEIAGDEPTASFVARHLADVPWCGRPPGPGERTALVDLRKARRVLGWRPAVGWLRGGRAGSGGAPGGAGREGLCRPGRTCIL